MMMVPKRVAMEMDPVMANGTAVEAFDASSEMDTAQSKEPIQKADYVNQRHR